MAKTRSPLQYKGVRAIRPPDLTIADRAPGSTDTAYIRGQLWLDKTNLTVYMYSGTTWIALGTGAVGGIATITGDTGGAESPSAGNFSLLGTANQITVTGGTNKETFSVPATFIAPGSIASVTSITSGTALVATTTMTAGTGITSTTGNIVASAGNISATLGSVAAGTTVTAGTSITATLGNITATNGNLVLTAAGNKMIRTSVGTTTAAGANSIGSVTLVAGTATVATTSVTASSLIRTWRESVGATASNVDIGQIVVGTRVVGTSFVINSVDSGDVSTIETNDVSVIGWEIIN